MEEAFLSGVDVALKVMAFMLGTMSITIPAGIVISAIAKVILTARRDHT